MTKSLTDRKNPPLSIDNLAYPFVEELKLSVALTYAEYSKSGLVVKDHGVPVTWVESELVEQHHLPLDSSGIVRIIVGSGLSISGVRKSHPSYSQALQAIDNGILELYRDNRYLRWCPSKND